jgi:hypothetical protein
MQGREGTGAARDLPSGSSRTVCRGAGQIWGEGGRREESERRWRNLLSLVSWRLGRAAFRGGERGYDWRVQSAEREHAERRG